MTLDLEALWRHLEPFLGDDADPDAAARLETLLARQLPRLLAKVDQLRAENERLDRDRSKASLRMAGALVERDALAARLQAVRDTARRLRDLAEEHLYDGDSDRPLLPGYEQAHRLADALDASLGTPGDEKPYRYDQCDDTCTVDCGHCKGQGKPKPSELTPDEATAAIDELRELWQRALEREGNLASAVADVMWKATQYGTTEDGDTFAYIVPKGAMHRLIGVAQQNGAHVPVAFRSPAGSSRWGGLLTNPDGSVSPVGSSGSAE